MDVDVLVEEKADMWKAQATVKDDLEMIQRRVKESLGLAFLSAFGILWQSF